MMEFQKTQHAFIDAIRNEAAPVPNGVASARMAIYRELFFNNIQGFVNQAFPVLRSIYPQAEWQQLQRQFFQTAKFDNPYFVSIAETFLAWFGEQPQQYPFAVELAHYEWVELYLATLAAEPVEPFNLKGPLRLASTALVLQYQYKVMYIKPNHLPTAPEAAGCFMLVYRNSADGIGFIELNPLSAALLNVLAEQQGLDFSELCRQFALLVPQIPMSEWLAQAESLCVDLAQKGIIQPSKIQQK